MKILSLFKRVEGGKQKGIHAKFVKAKNTQRLILFCFAKNLGGLSVKFGKRKGIHAKFAKKKYAKSAKITVL